MSIIIANWNGGEVFKNCLLSLSQITYPNWELIVVDNGSSDGSNDLAEKILGKKIRVLLISNPTNLGFVKANNQGYLVSSGKYLLLLNNDTKVTADFLNKLVSFAEKDSKIGVVQPKILMMDSPGLLDNAGSFLTRIGFLAHRGFMEKDSAKFSQTQEVFSAKGACLLIRKSLVDKISLFDEDFFSYFEESDFCFRVLLAGAKVVFFPGAVIYHKVGFTIKRLDVLNINYHYYKNRISSLIKNLEMENLIPILFAHLVISICIAGFFLLRGKIKNCWMILKAIIWNIVNLPRTLKKRSEVQKIRIIPDHQIFEKLIRPVDLRQFYQDFKRVEKDLARS